MQVIIGGVHKLGGVYLKDLRQTAIQTSVSTRDNMAGWGKTALDSRLKLPLGWLKAQDQGLEPAIVSVSKSRYATWMTFLKKKDGDPNCPVCLMDKKSRLAVTECGNLYCKDCMILMINGSGGFEVRHVTPIFKSFGSIPICQIEWGQLC